jgi:hypothetical protein
MRLIAAAAAACLLAGGAMAGTNTGSGAPAETAEHEAGGQNGADYAPDATTEKAPEEKAGAAREADKEAESKTAAAKESSETKAGKSKKVCTSVRVTGSRMAKQVCRTVEE